MSLEFTEIVIYVRDVPAATRYYRDVLGLTLKWEADGLAEFDAGRGVHFLLHDYDGDGPPPPPLPSFYVDDIHGVREQLVQRGADLPEVADEGWGLIIRFTDPEGNKLAIERPHDEH